jgi:GTP-binding protein EngB required for normal cell division
MSIAPARPGQPDGAAVANRLGGLERALPVLADRVDATRVERARLVAERVGQRLDLSAGHTVVALAGATGSGKSSLFNALVGLDLSAVGVRRPTTGLPHACVWDPDGATELLDWLGIPPRLQTARESVLDAESQAELRGLVLLDLPDHDSIETAHREYVDRIVQMADMIVWVLDPQKYADAAVHLRYLEAQARHVSVLVVVLNQVDRLAPEQVELCLDDLRRLLTEDGLHGVRVLTTSATRGDGLPELRELLAESVAGHEVAARRLTADLDGVAAELHGVTGPEVREDIDRTSVKRLCAALAHAAGVLAIGEAVERAYRQQARRATLFPPVRLLRALSRRRARRARLDGAPEAAAVLSAQVETALRDLADTAAHGLPEPWPTQTRAAALSSLAELPAELERAVGGVDLGLTRSRGWWRVSTAIQVVALAAALSGLGWLVGARTSGLSEPRLAGVPAPWALLTVALVVAVLVWVVSWAVAAEVAGRVRGAAEEAMQDAVTAVARQRVLAPVRAQLRAYAEVRESLSTLDQR